MISDPVAKLRGGGCGEFLAWLRQATVEEEERRGPPPTARFGTVVTRAPLFFIQV
jgi:hypothetical protein